MTWTGTTMLRTVAALIVVLPGCHHNGPVGDEADAAYVAAYGYLIQYRTHFFPVAVDQVCLDGPDGRRMAWRMRGSYMRVRADCPYMTPGYVPADWGLDSVAVISLARGDSAPLWGDPLPPYPTRSWIRDAKGRRRKESWAEFLLRALRTRHHEVEATIRYADARVRSADFDCFLYRTSRGWGIEQCRFSDVKWRGRPATSADDVSGCWRLAWQPLHEEDTAGLPTAVSLSTDPEGGDAPWQEYRMTAVLGAPDSTSAAWRMAQGSGRWQWGLDSQVVWLGAGGGYEGIVGTLALDPMGDGLRGVAVYFRELTGRPSITDPMWQVEGRRVPCGPASAR